VTLKTALPADAAAIRALVGRDRERSQILGCLADARAGRGRLVLVAGEPGIGKSRLADAIAVDAAGQGTRVLWGRSWDAAGAPPYWPWVQILRSYLRITDPDDLRAQLSLGAADVAQMLPELRDALPGLEPPSATDPESARFQLFDSTTTLLRNAAQDQGLVLILDDLQSADPASILLLRFLASQLGDSSLLVVATYRDVELTPDHPLTAALPELSRLPSTVEIELQGLDEVATRSLVSGAAGFEPGDGLIRALHRSTNGNPLFIGETLRLLAAEGRLAAGMDTDALRLAVVPARVHEVIARRLAHLSAPSRELLQLAAVLGPEFSIESLRHVAGRTGDEVLDQIDEAIDAGLLSSVAGAPGRHRFGHDLIRETLYRELKPARRARLHRQTALALEALYGADADAHLAELAHQFFEAESAGEQERAIAYATRAGGQAAQLLAYEEAARLFSMALAAMEAHAPIDRHELGELLLALGEAQDRSGDRLEAGRTFLRAAETARRTGAAEQLARAALGYGGRFVWKRAGRDLHLVPLLQDALVMLGGHDNRLRARLLARLSCALRSEPSREHRDALSQQAVDLARSLQDPATLAYALEGRFWAIWWPENPEQRLSIALELRQAAEAAGDTERLAGSHQAAWAVLLELGRMTEARIESDLLERRMEELRQPAQRWLLSLARALQLLLEGHFEEADVLITHALENALLERDEVSATRSQLFLLRRDQDRLSEVEEGTRSAVEAFPWFPVHRAELALLLLETGRRREAQILFDALARDRFSVFHRDNQWLTEVAIASEVCAKLGDGEAGQVLYEELAPFAGFHAVGHGEGSVGAVDRYLGLLAELLGRTDDAIRHLEDAERLNEQMGARPWTLRTQADLGRVLLGRNLPPDRAQAADLLRSARAGAAQIGMVALLAQMGSEDGDNRELPLTPTPIVEHTFRREGDYWLVEFDGGIIRVRDAKGMAYLARLLANPGREVHVLDLAGQSGVSAVGARHNEDGLRSEGLGDAGAVLDPQAKAEYRLRIDELREEIAEAESWNDPERATQARGELEFLAREISGAVGIGGRDRKAAAASERARLSVTRAIRSSVNNVRSVQPQLGAHLDATIRTGTYCVYAPDPRVPVHWVV
jgi:AAA ATPase domain